MEHFGTFSYFYCSNTWFNSTQIVLFLLNADVQFHGWYGENTFTLSDL